MTAIDLTKATEAAAKDSHRQYENNGERNAIGWYQRIPWHKLDGATKDQFRAQAQPIVKAALPHIEKQIRAQIAEEIRTAAITLTSGSIAEVARSTQRQTARIAEGQ